MRSPCSPRNWLAGIRGCVESAAESCRGDAGLGDTLRLLAARSGLARGHACHGGAAGWALADQQSPAPVAARTEAVAFLLAERPGNIDPLHRIATPLVGSVHVLAGQLPHLPADPDWIADWMTAERRIARQTEQTFQGMSTLFEEAGMVALAARAGGQFRVYCEQYECVRYANSSGPPVAAPVLYLPTAGQMASMVRSAPRWGWRTVVRLLSCSRVTWPFLHDSNGLAAGTTTRWQPDGFRDQQPGRWDFRASAAGPVEP